MQTITVTMTAETIGLILEGLGKLPYERVEGLINGFRQALQKKPAEDLPQGFASDENAPHAQTTVYAADVAREFETSNAQG